MKRILFICIGVFAFCSLTSAQTPQTDWRESLKAITELIKSNPQQAQLQATQLVKDKKYKKNIDFIVGLGDAYLKAKNIPEAQKYLTIAQNVNLKNPRVSILEGDIAIEQNDPGKACQLYEQAIYFDKNCFEAYEKYAKVYQGANPEVAISKLDELKAVNPTKAAEVDKTEAKIYYSKNQFDKAVEAYARFIDTPIATESDINRYAFALFLTHNFNKSLEIAQKGLERNSRSAVYNRLAMYNNADLKNYTEAEKAADAFFNASDSAKFSYLDYKYYGFILSNQKKYPQAITAYKNALKEDSTQVELWNEISSAYEADENYNEAIPAFLKYYSSLSGDAKTPELLFELGRLYYGKGTNIDEKTDAAGRKAAFLLADSTFAVVAQERPDSYIANLWRARTNSNLDPETTQGLAKPYYEKTMEMLQSKGDPKYNSSLSECYRYLAYFYYLKKQTVQAKDFCNKVLAIDPTNDVAKKLLSSMK